MARRFWLLKSDPETFGLDRLEASPNQATGWDGVRNYQARNLLRDEIAVGDQALFYHSQAKPPAVVGTIEIIRAGYPDPTQFDRRAAGFDAKSSRDAPRWYAVEIKLKHRLARPIGLPELRETPGLDEMVLLRRSRLSVQPVTAAEWKIILALGRR